MDWGVSRLNLNSLSLHHFPLLKHKKELCYTFYGLCMVHLQMILYLLTHHLHHRTHQSYDQVTMAQAFNNIHIL